MFGIESDSFQYDASIRNMDYLKSEKVFPGNILITYGLLEFQSYGPCTIIFSYCKGMPATVLVAMCIRINSSTQARVVIASDSKLIDEFGLVGFERVVAHKTFTAKMLGGGSSSSIFFYIRKKIFKRAVGEALCSTKTLDTLDGYNMGF